MNVNQDLIFLKLGGSLITDKDQPETPRLELIEALALAIRHALDEKPGLKLLLGHGSGSFGHHAASKHNTRDGVFSPQGWQGFHQTWLSAHALNQIVLDACLRAGLPVISFPPSAAVTTHNHQITSWDTAPIVAALEHGMFPLVFGDVIFDSTIGGTILSTEELFAHLAYLLQPTRILLAGIEPGVWQDYPACTRLLPVINHQDLDALDGSLLSSASVDVTGGMRAKVDLMCRLAAEISGLEGQIFSALEPDHLRQAILGIPLGTRII